MKITSVIKRVKEEGVPEASRYYMKKLIPLKCEEPEPEIEQEEEKIYSILLLTNRDSDNVGDQVIEACDISLISTVMKNLNIEKKNFKINSRAASLVSQKYLATKDETLLKTAEKLISESDIVFFGGAPLFNFRYQNFYERTAVTLEIAEKYNKPVIFSAIGVEGYDDNNEKCQRLKKTLNFDCVQQITTRDDFESLKKFVENEQLTIDKVADPAVFTSKVFKKFAMWNSATQNKKVGVFILRSNGFLDNGINFSREAAAEFWLKLVDELEDKGYDYEVLTSGHFGDEAFLDYLIKNYGLNANKCVFNINCPEKLIQKISSYDAVISCRLHPSIISFSFDVPSFGLVWNSKVRSFYKSIGYEDRLVDINDIAAEDIVQRIGTAIEQGVNKDEKYLLSVYNSMFYSIKRALCIEESEVLPYKYSELIENIIAFDGTSEKEKEEKLKRKFRRTYGKYNELFEKNMQNKAIVNQLTAKHVGFTVIYNGGIKSNKLACDYDESQGEVQILGSGSTEYRVKTPVKNDGKTRLIKNAFLYPGATFCGWRMRYKDNDIWYWYLEDKTSKLQLDYEEGNDKAFYILKDEEFIPYIPAESVTTVVLEAVWDLEV